MIRRRTATLTVAAVSVALATLAVVTANAIDKPPSPIVGCAERNTSTITLAHLIRRNDALADGWTIEWLPTRDGDQLCLRHEENR